ncbi:hypothetical protein CVT26_010896 [Gymnopilus dilepis]|uniref:Uncharacterized protein n=1 Tax=Gymnopilus dilepis TaxID=231916 RepID=A0A409WSQ7_9AGAR|nr:hypothetical protein CVT26_010896 [Gymnopilus dilepis]
MASPISESSATNDELAEAIKLRAKYTHFRILVIGRANAGKTTVLKRVCNTDEEPCIYDEDGKNLVRHHLSGMSQSANLTFAAGSDGGALQRGIHDVHRPFSFKSNPEFIFHDSPGFEKGGAGELEKVRAFIADRAKARDVMDQIHAIWFCFYPDVSRPLLQLEQDFFNEQRAGNVPVVAIFTKFDDLVSQVWDRDKDYDANENKARATLSERFEYPLRKCNFPPRAYLHLEALNDDEGNHQEQVGVLIEKTAASIDNLALKMLFVNVQQNNLEVCIRAAVNK